MKIYKKLILGTVLGSCLAMSVMGMKGVEFDKEVRFNEKICNDLIQQVNKEKSIGVRYNVEMVKAEIKQRWNNNNNINYNKKIFEQIDWHDFTFSLFQEQINRKYKNIDDKDRELVLGYAYDMYKDTMRYSLMEHVAGFEKSREIFLADLKKADSFYEEVQKILSWRFEYCILFGKDKINEWSSDINTWCQSERCSGIKVPDEILSLVKKYAQGELYKLEEFIWGWYMGGLKDAFEYYRNEVIKDKMKHLVWDVICKQMAKESTEKLEKYNKEVEEWIKQQPKNRVTIRKIYASFKDIVFEGWWSPDRYTKNMYRIKPEYDMVDIFKNIINECYLKNENVFNEIGNKTKNLRKLQKDWDEYNCADDCEDDRDDEYRELIKKKEEDLQLAYKQVVHAYIKAHPEYFEINSDREARSYDYTNPIVFEGMRSRINDVYKRLKGEYSTIEEKLTKECGLKFNFNFKKEAEKRLGGRFYSPADIDREMFYELIRRGLSGVVCNGFEEKDAKDTLRNISLVRLLTMPNIFMKAVDIIPNSNAEVIFDKTLDKNKVEKFLYHIEWAKFKLNEALARFGLKISEANIEGVDSFMAKIFFGNTKKGTVREIDKRLKEIENSTIENLGNVLGFKIVNDYFNLEVDFKQVCDFKNSFQVACILNLVVNKNGGRYNSTYYYILNGINDEKYRESVKAELYSEIVRDLKVASELDPPMTYRDFYEKVRKNELRTYLSNRVLSMIKEAKNDLSDIKKDYINLSDIKALRKEIEEDKNYINKYYTRLKRYTERNDRRLLVYINYRVMINDCLKRCLNNMKKIDCWTEKYNKTKSDLSAMYSGRVFSGEFVQYLKKCELGEEFNHLREKLDKIEERNNENAKTLKEVEEKTNEVKSLCEKRLNEIMLEYVAEEKCYKLFYVTFDIDTPWIIKYNVLGHKENVLGKMELKVDFHKKFSDEIFEHLDNADWLTGYDSLVDSNSLSTDDRSDLYVACIKTMPYSWLRILSMSTMKVYDKYKNESGTIKRTTAENAMMNLVGCVGSNIEEIRAGKNELFNRFTICDKNSRFVGGIKVTDIKFGEYKFGKEKK